MNKTQKYTILSITLILLLGIGIYFYAKPESREIAKDLYGEEISAEIAKIEANKVYYDDSSDFDAENYGFDFEKFENMLNDRYPKEAIELYLKNSKIFPVDTQIAYNEKILEMLSNRIASIKDIKKYNFARLNTDADTLIEVRKEKDEWSFELSIDDAYLIPLAITLDCFGGSGFFTLVILAEKTVTSQNEAIAHNGKLLLGDISELEKKDLSGFNSYKDALLIYDKYISEFMQTAPSNNYKSIVMHKNKLKELKKNLSEHRMEYISSSFLAPRFISSLSLAKTYNNQWNIWGIASRDEKLIDGAFKALGNHGDLIMAASEDCRDAFIYTILPALKKKLSEKAYNSKITLTGYRSEGSTGAKLWLDWDN